MILIKLEKKMDIIVTKDKEHNKRIKDIISKDIICPECKENTLMNMDSFKCNFHGCKNNHNNDIALNEFSKLKKLI